MAEDSEHAKGRLTMDVGKSKPPNHFAAFPQGDDRKPFRYLWCWLRQGTSTNSKPEYVDKSEDSDPTWQQSLTMVLIRILWFLAPYLAKLGHAIEVFGNIWVANGGLLKTVWRFSLSALFLFQKNFLVVPDKKSGDYYTVIGLMDPRTALHVGDSTDTKQLEGASDTSNASAFPGTEHGSRGTGDVLVMAAKLAYENAAVVEKVVTEAWGMHFVKFLDCWDAFQKRNSTQVFLFTDKPTDAGAVVIAWRGTEAFNAYDWSTDVDISWCEIEGMGKVHMGFLEALGLANRADMSTFEIFRTINDPGTPRTPASGLPQRVIDEPTKILAYDDVTARVKELLRQHPNAKLFITGHSLGGALSALYAGMLYLNSEKELTDRIGAVYTFGQPRVGNEEFAEYMNSKAKEDLRDWYYRVVYCNDLVPRVPFDDKIFRFKHWGMCFYFNSLFKGQTLSEAPNRNFFVIRDIAIMHLNAAWELVNSVLLRYTYGPEFRESKASILYRALGLLVPGVGGHSPVNYVNAIRLGTPSPLVAQVSSEVRNVEGDLIGVAETAHISLTNVRDAVLDAIRSALSGKPGKPDGHYSANGSQQPKISLHSD